LHILASPGLVDRVRAEIAPFAKVSQPISIGSISESPKLTISHEGLSKHCPLFKSTFFEAMRLSSQPWSIRKVATDVVISGRNIADPTSFALRRGEYVSLPHDLHMRDPKYFKDPEKFEPERFLVRNEDGSLSADLGTIRPYGGGPSMCKGRIFAERECLALVAGVLMFWEIEPANKKMGWEIPGQKKTSAISLPAHDTRVRIKRRHFDWS
jgi:cytochrome P450